MDNIKIKAPGPLYNGMAVLFKAPCACTAVGGLAVSYGNTEQLFTFKDAHGNTLTGIGNLFAEGAFVKALLDTVNGFAYLQNADTNAYLEAELAKKYSPANKPTPADLGAIGRDGGIMTGDLSIQKAAPSLELYHQETGRFFTAFMSSDGNVYLRNSADGTNRTTLYLQPETTGRIDRMLRLQKMVDSHAEYYNIFGEHNKPSGSYTGNGSTAERVIDLGITADGNDIVAVRSEDGLAFVTRASGAYFNATGVLSLAYSNAHLESRDLGDERGSNALVMVLKATHAAVNKSSIKYYWRVM